MTIIEKAALLCSARASQWAMDSDGPGSYYDAKGALGAGRRVERLAWKVFDKITDRCNIGSCAIVWAEAAARLTNGEVKL